MLPNAKDISDAERAKQFIAYFIAMHPKQFEPLEKNNEIYGFRKGTEEKGDFAIIPTV